jgi:predicted nucleic acid-binding protein
MILVVDASVAVKLGVFEEGSLEARRLLGRGASIKAPDLLVAEVSSALWRKELRGDLDEAERRAGLAAAISAYDELLPCKDLADRALELAVALKHPVYDCFYLALAEREDATFVTADGRLLSRLSQGGWAGKFEAL